MWQRSRGVRGVHFPAYLGDTESCLPVGAYYSICRLMTKALHELHKLRVVHGDIKLANFCYEMDKNDFVVGVQLIDFGALRLR